MGDAARRDRRAGTRCGCRRSAGSPPTCTPLDPAAEVPPADLIPRRPRRATPYLYSDAEITALIAAAASLRFPLRAATYQTLIGLLAVTGMRVGEAIRLDRADVDLDGRRADRPRDQVRQVPAGAAAPHHGRPRCAATCGCGTGCTPGPATPALFISPAGTRLIYCNVHATFQRLARQRRAAAPLGRRAARASTTSATPSRSRSLLDAYAAGQDGQARLALLSTYLGHVDPAATYWYLSAAPELLALAGQRLDAPPAGAAVTALAPTLQAFFTDRLARQRQASPHTIAAYRDTWRLLLGFAAGQRRQAALASSTSPTSTPR